MSLSPGLAVSPAPPPPRMSATHPAVVDVLSICASLGLLSAVDLGVMCMTAKPVRSVVDVPHVWRGVIAALAGLRSTHGLDVAAFFGGGEGGWKQLMPFVCPQPSTFASHFQFNLHLGFLQPVLGSPEARSPNDARLRVMYSGQRIGGNRAVVTTQPFPSLSSQLPSVPYTGAFRCLVDGGPTSVVHCGPQLLAYFEITIEEPPPAFAAAHSQNPGCVAVGIASKRFPLGCRMPGWDRHSYGYHGDDGHIFHSSGMGTAFAKTFGVGDVVGCGIDFSGCLLEEWRTQQAATPAAAPSREPPYVPLFFTVNGELQGTAFQYVDATVPWYPAVGLDAHTPVFLNCGREPFVYDLAAHSAAAWERVRAALPGAVGLPQAVNAMLGLRIPNLGEASRLVPPEFAQTHGARLAKGALLPTLPGSGASAGAGIGDDAAGAGAGVRRTVETGPDTDVDDDAEELMELLAVRLDDASLRRVAPILMHRLIRRAGRQQAAARTEAQSRNPDGDENGGWSLRPWQFGLPPDMPGVGSLLSDDDSDSDGSWVENTDDDSDSEYMGEDDEDEPVVQVWNGAALEVHSDDEPDSALLPPTILGRRQVSTEPVALAPPVPAGVPPGSPVVANLGRRLASPPRSPAVQAAVGAEPPTMSEILDATVSRASLTDMLLTLLGGGVPDSGHLSDRSMDSD